MLQIGAGGTSGTLDSLVDDKAALAFNRSDSSTFAGSVFGPGSVTKLGAGTLVVTGYLVQTGGTTISDGVLQIGDGGTSGGITGDILDNAALVADRSDDVEYDDVISGTGAFTKLGSGALLLTGANTYTGPTFVNQGLLVLSGSLTSNTTVGSGGALSGAGTIGGALVNNGVLSPGTTADPFGTLTVAGAFTSNGGSTLDAAVNAAGQHNQLLAGSATLNGGAVAVSAAPGLYGIETDYRILGATGAVTGAFTGVSSPTGLSASIVYDAHDAFLRLRRTSTSFGSTSGLSGNQARAAGGLDAAVTGANPAVFSTYAGLYNTLIFAPASALSANFSNISGDALTAFDLAAQASADRFHDQLGDQAADHVRGPAGDPNVWATISRDHDNIDSDGDGPGFDTNATQFAGGVDVIPQAGLDLGVAVGASKDDLSIADRNASGKMDSWSLGAYGRYEAGQLYVAGQVSFDWHHIKTRRALLMGGLASGDYHAHTWGVSGEAGGDFVGGGLRLQPHLGFKVLDVRQNGFTESGGVGALDVAATRFDSERFVAGVRLMSANPMAKVRPFASAAFEHEFGDRVADETNSLPSLTSFTVASTRLGREIFTAQAGGEADVAKGVSVFVTGRYSTRSNADSKSILGGLKVSW